MILTILVTIFFFLAFIVFLFLGYREKSLWKQFVSINSFIAGANSIKEILPSNYNGIVNIIRITIGLFVIGIFAYHNFHCNKINDI